MKGEKSIVKNYVYNVMLSILNIIFPLITFPYASRILGAEGIGRVAFSNSIINYFIMFASLGIPVYGVREIAKVRNDSDKASKVFTEIFIINFITTIFSIIIYYSLIISTSLFSSDKILFSVMGIMLLLNVFNLDWLYQGFEEYKFITVRSIIIKILSIVFLYLTVRTRNDYINYAVVTIIALSGSNTINALMSRKIVKISMRNVDFKRHIAPILTIFFMGLAINIYNNIDSTMLGIQAGAEYVGYYTAAVKINRMIVNVIISLGVVLLPRLSYYIENKQIDDFKNVIDKSINFIFLLALPSCVGLFILSPEIIRIFSGIDFEPAILTMRINVAIIAFISVANLTSMQILLPLKKERYVMTSAIAAAIVNLGLNYILIPLYKQNGAAISSLLAEFTTMLIQVIYCRKYLGGKLLSKDKIKYVLGVFLIILTTTVIKKVLTGDLTIILLSTLLGGIIYIIIMIALKEEVSMYILSKFKIISRLGS